MILCMFNCAFHQCTFYLHTLVRGLSQGHGLALLDSWSFPCTLGACLCKAAEVEMQISISIESISIGGLVRIYLPLNPKNMSIRLGVFCSMSCCTKRSTFVQSGIWVSVSADIILHKHALGGFSFICADISVFSPFLITCFLCSSHWRRLWTVPRAGKASLLCVWVCKGLIWASKGFKDP